MSCQYIVLYAGKRWLMHLPDCGVLTLIALLQMIATFTRRMPVNSYKLAIHAKTKYLERT